MLNRTHRFHGLNSLNYVYRQGQSVRGSQVALRYSLNRRRQTFRAAVVVSKKVSKSAVARNRLRRRIYGALDGYAAQITQPYDLVFTVFSAQLAEIGAPDLERLIGEQLSKAAVIDGATNAQ